VQRGIVSGPSIHEGYIMSILDKAKNISGKVAEKAGDLGGEELIADTIIRAVNKQ